MPDPSGGQRPAYMGRKACGCVVAIMSASCPDAAADVLGWIDDGLTVERGTATQARNSFTVCECKELPNVD